MEQFIKGGQPLESQFYEPLPLLQKDYWQCGSFSVMRGPINKSS